MINYITSFKNINTNSDYYLDAEYYKIKMYLERYGYTVTGNRERDLLIYEEVLALGLDEPEETSDDEENKSIPWYEFMKEIGLIATGDLDKDKQTMIDELTERINNADDEDEFNYYNDLMSQVNYKFVENNTSTSSYNSSDYSVANRIMSDLNKILLLNY